MSAITPLTPPARWWHALENKKVVCRLCPRECHIPVGSRGFCFVRANVDGQLELTTYGRSSGFCIDPVEKKPLNHFLPGTPILSFGTAGCNLGCKFCQNWDISKSREIDKVSHIAEPEAIVQAALRTGCRSLAFTYNDPVIWAEYALDIAKVAHAHGLKTVAVTAGYISREARGEFYQHMDAANVDLKAFTDFFYSKLCQVNLEPILETLKFLKHETNVWFELTNLMIPGENDSTEETKAMCHWIIENLGPDVPIHFTAFHPDFKMRETPPTPPETLVHARQIALDAGIRYAYVGNVNDVAHQSTYCHSCGKLLIQRDWYELGEYHIRHNACRFCGTTIPGVFDDAGPGKWGRKRQPIAIGEDASHLVRMTTSVKNKPLFSPQNSLNIQPSAVTTFAPAQPDAPTASPSPVPARNENPPAPAPQIDFTPQQDAGILAFTRAIVESSLRGEFFTKARLPDPLAHAPSYGLFVSLFRGRQLRSCKGQWGSPSSGALPPLSQILPAIARDAAANDPRFPRITLAELPYLTFEVSLMHSPQLIESRGTDRINSVHVGTHGLVIMHPGGTGLLLPHVATEAGWDAKTFLEHICQKAGLPPQTWRDDQARLMTFRARKIEAPPPVAELDPGQIGATGLSHLLAYIHHLLAGHPEASTPPGFPNQIQMPALYQVHPEELGLFLQTPAGITGAALAPNASLFSLAKIAAQSLAVELSRRAASEPVQKMTLLWQPLALTAADYPSRHQTLASSAVFAQANGQGTLMVPHPDIRTDTIAQALTALKITHQQWLQEPSGRIRIMAFNALHCHNQPAPATVPVPQASPPGQVRPAFRAGQFYPADPTQMDADVDAYLHAAGRGQFPPQTYRAIMLPHAGWQFCGSTMGKTLAGVQLPKTLIIIGPKHTPLGPPCSIANHAAWQIPGTPIPLATSIVQQLCRNIPILQYEAEAHRQEHAIEVLLPFLFRLRPDLQIVPIVLGPSAPESIEPLVTGIAALLRDIRAAGGEVPLLVISSDMNHFASEAENRRRDMLALDAMKTGNPRHLYETCMNNDVSMCGLLPAVAVMQALQKHTPAITPKLIDYSTSAAASGDTSRVVGYAGVVIP